MEDSIFKPKSERPSAPEYPFEAGVSQILDKIMDILKKQPYAVVAFNASGANVGKTELARTLTRKLYQQGIYSKSFHDLSEVHVEDIKKKMVFILEQMQWDASECDLHGSIRKHHDADVIGSLDKIGCKVKGIDLWIGIYRPDKPFVPISQSEGKEAPLADIIIRNEGATDQYRLTNKPS